MRINRKIIAVFYLAASCSYLEFERGLMGPLRSDSLLRYCLRDGVAGIRYGSDIYYSTFLKKGRRSICPLIREYINTYICHGLVAV